MVGRPQSRRRPDDGKGNGWYWYENLSTTDPGRRLLQRLDTASVSGVIRRAETLFAPPRSSKQSTGAVLSWPGDE